MKIRIFLVIAISRLNFVLTKNDDDTCNPHAITEVNCVATVGSNGVRYTLFFKEINWHKAKTGVIKAALNKLQSSKMLIFTALDSVIHIILVYRGALKEECLKHNGGLTSTNIIVNSSSALGKNIWLSQNGQCSIVPNNICSYNFGCIDCSSHLDGFLCENATSTSCQTYNSTVGNSLTTSSPSVIVEKNVQQAAGTTISDQNIDTSRISDLPTSQAIESTELYIKATTSATENFQPSQTITIETTQNSRIFRTSSLETNKIIETSLMSQITEQLTASATVVSQITDIYTFSESTHLTIYVSKLASLSEESYTSSVTIARLSADLSTVHISNTGITPMLNATYVLIDSSQSSYTAETALPVVTTNLTKMATDSGQSSSPRQCPCQYKKSTLLSNHQKIENYLINRKTFSQYKRLLYSVYDPRVTAIVIGNTGIILLVVAASIIAVPDFLRLYDICKGEVLNTLAREHRLKIEKGTRPFIYPDCVVDVKEPTII